ncbi:TPA: P1 family peptidase [Burkholderia vietnamiensis]|uniref:DmpA family aminopeptidase n=1 Tax=Burkholderia vietnamiensis TaxID=60552 RepID=UPI00075EBC96|nr:P1 family peptidase [Burkholderia vietnamiensis]KVR96345.1 aminopeptidase [Burkholderia vietnamiensis]MCO1346574.1 P1 family peptidase [Burkholderia vietnamiensis]MCO1429334.1 P1 family peptidase [Burkholderia vietnamiensis]UQN50550.1 P1 family peptidase [Burkholderia vietnamiensis]HDR9237955.1 P1 family peptidase [Burkholderia vietnamiensis]
MAGVPMWSATLPAGPRGTLADVPGVTVGHATLAAGDVQTGVTIVKPHAGDLYRSKVPAGAAVINGFGKSVGLVQVDELGTLETPIALTNTFGVGALANAQTRAAIEQNPQIGRDWPTVNPLVFECNDGYLNDIQAFAVTAAHYDAACGGASRDFARGAVGAGRGMSCFDLKGGIGSASRVAVAAGRPYTVGALVLANFGRLPMLTLAGVPVGRIVAQRRAVSCVSRAQATDATAPEQGSIIVLLATDAPLDARQLSRLARRAGAGLARTGSVYGHGSGDLALAFSTAYTIAHDASTVSLPALVADAALDPLFMAAAESVEHAIVDALLQAVTVTGRDGHVRQSLRDAVNDLDRLFGGQDDGLPTRS